MRERPFRTMTLASNTPGTDERTLPVGQCTPPQIARVKSRLSPDLRTLTGTGLPITAEHVSLRTLTGEGSVHVDAGVFATMVAQQAIISPCKTQRPRGSQATIMLSYPTSPPPTPACSPQRTSPFSLLRKGQRKVGTLTCHPLQSSHFPPSCKPLLYQRSAEGDSREQVLRSSLMRKPSEHWQTKDSSVFRHSCSQPWSCFAQWSTPVGVTHENMKKQEHQHGALKHQTSSEAAPEEPHHFILPCATGLSGKSALLCFPISLQSKAPTTPALVLMPAALCARVVAPQCASPISQQGKRGSGRQSCSSKATSPTEW